MMTFPVRLIRGNTSSPSAHCGQERPRSDGKLHSDKCRQAAGDPTPNNKKPTTNQFNFKDQTGNTFQPGGKFI